MTSSCSPYFSHYDLRTGIALTHRRSSEHPAQAALVRAVVGSHQNRTLLEIPGTPYELFADYQSAAEGNGYLVIAAGDKMGRQIAPGQALFTGVVAAARERAPFAWRHIMQLYIPLAIGAACNVITHAPGPMPKDAPWLCGYSDPAVLMLNATERSALTAIVRSAAATLVDICGRGWQCSRDAGPVVALDPNDYPELQPDED